MSRPRTIDDDDLLAAATAVLAEVGPAQFTLAKAAARAGVAAATYIKRFGTKQGLLLALSRQWGGAIAEAMEEAAAGTTGVDRIRAAAMWGVAEMDVPEHAANLLAALAWDLQDPQLTALLDRGWATWRACVRGRIEESIKAGELPDAPDPVVAAEMLFALVEGTRIGWCVHPEGSLEARVRRVIDELITGWGSAR